MATALPYTNSNLKISLLGLEGFVSVVLLPEAACHWQPTGLDDLIVFHLAHIASKVIKMHFIQWPIF